MVKIKRMYAKDDCIHYKMVRMKICCGRHQLGGVCNIPSEDGIVRNKICSTKMKYCNYISKEKVQEEI